MQRRDGENHVTKRNGRLESDTVKNRDREEGERGQKVEGKRDEREGV